MKTFFCLFILIFISSFSIADSFKIDSYYYTDSAPKPNETGANIIFNLNTDVSCEGQLTNKIFISKDSYKLATTTYYLVRFWPSYFLRQAALSDAEVQLALGRYDDVLNACEVGFKYDGSSQERWHEPHEFKVSDTDDSNPIDTVYYQLFIITRNPTFTPWVYADTDYSVTCDGITTNRIIPTTNPNEFGYTIPNAFGNKASEHYSSENTRSFFDLLSGKIEQYSVGRYVPQLNACTIYNVEYSENSISSAAIELGRQQCIDAPETCDLFSRDEIDSAIEIGLQDGVTQCIDSPENCGLFSQLDIDLSFTTGRDEGIQDCTNNPETCGLFSQASIEDSKAQGFTLGEQFCKNTPELCGLYSQTEVDNAFANGESSGSQTCIENPQECGLFSEENINEAFTSGEISGKTSCTSDPTTCNLYSLEQMNSIVDQQLSESIKAIALSLPKGALKYICKKQNDSALCSYYESKRRHKYHEFKHKYYKNKEHLIYKIYNKLETHAKKSYHSKH